MGPHGDVGPGTCVGFLGDYFHRQQYVSGGLTSFRTTLKGVLAGWGGTSLDEVVTPSSGCLYILGENVLFSLFALLRMQLLREVQAPSFPRFRWRQIPFKVENVRELNTKGDKEMHTRGFCTGKALHLFKCISCLLRTIQPTRKIRETQNPLKRIGPKYRRERVRERGRRDRETWRGREEREGGKEGGRGKGEGHGEGEGEGEKEGEVENWLKVSHQQPRRIAQPPVCVRRP